MSLKALFIGLGGVGQRHLRNLLKLQPGASISCVRKRKQCFEINNDLSTDHSVDVLQKYNIQEFSSLEQAIAAKPDIAIIATPTSKHFESAINLAEAGIHTYIEKPATASFEQTLQLKEAFAAARATLHVGFQLKFHPLVLRFKSLLDQGVLGKLSFADVTIVSNMPKWHPYEAYEELYAANKSLGGGVILTESHEVDLLTWFFGIPEKVVSFGGMTSQYNLDVEDTVCSIAMFKGKGYSFPVNLKQCFIQPNPKRSITIFGANGQLELNLQENYLELKDAESAIVERNEVNGFDRNELFIEALDEFLRSINAGFIGRNDILNGLNTQELLSNLSHSLQNNKIMSFEK